MMPKVSVIIPVYNVENYFRQCIESVINQTLKDIEIILVDDGSTDSSGKICDEYREKDNRITVIHQKNQYVGVARNNGMAIATGEYLICLDSDDWFDEEMLESMYNKAKETDADITICREKAYYEKTKEISDTFVAVAPPDKLIFSHKDLKDKLFTFCPLWPWDKMYKRSFLVENNIKYPIHRVVAASEDMTFICLSFALAEKITFLDKILITHRYHSKSLEATRNRFTGYFALRELERELKNRDIFEQFKKPFINLALDYLIFHYAYTKKKYKNTVYKLMREQWFKHFNFEKYDRNYFNSLQNYFFYKKATKHRTRMGLRLSLNKRMLAVLLRIYF